METFKNFASVRNSGFQLVVNGWRVSVMFGPGNYVADKDIRFSTEWNVPLNGTKSIWDCDTAEIMIWNDTTGENMFELNDGILNDQVMGWCTSDCVARIIGCLASCGDEDPRRAIVQIFEAQ